MDMGSPKDYKYLERTKCFEAKGVDDTRYFDEIKKSMVHIGFSEADMKSIWNLLCAILELGNI